MRVRLGLTTITIAALMLGGTALAQTEMEQLQPGAGSGSPLGAEQLAPDDVGDRTRVESITPQGPADVQVEQPKGQDLCDPSVPESVRRRAGIDCEREISVDGRPEQRPLAEKPLLTPDGQSLEKQVEDLGLGKDVPPTVILQQ